ncbi:uroporphyrinogen decarboxylase [Muricomes intestini]|jgi:uroporphyrinogen decarboxylase|uniref:Uroporphyrinogen decarboxylase n=2 Tax=Muricomes intestini TaxID=1796634 RepID=A0A4R3K696_9FIRM|nr:uroporphyrinogen decarboxylase family protein [Muricomes intestini]TCS78305.1 uroporphyrinogen decarboxylase [Muricomes intestini]HAX51048.1 uroporphyrinogen decarboxylase [Lachnospiraceae bacterium]
MTPKEILIQTLKHQETEQVAWVPFAGVHAGRLLGYTATEVLQDEEKLFQSLMEVNKLYKPSGQPVIFDLQVEAECLGCDLVWADNAPPSVSEHPLEGEEELITPCYCTIPTKESGRIPMILNVMKRMKEKVGKTTALYGLICGPFTLATHLRGNDIFMDMYDDEEAVEEFLTYCGAVAMKMADYYIEAGMDVIAVVDPLISQISSDHFKQFMSEPFSKLFAYIREKGAYSSFFVCGDATRNIEVMCKTNPDSISIDENVDLLAAKAITDKYNVAIGGNIPLTTIMLHGSQQDNMKFAVDLLDKIKNKKNLILAPGCDMPYEVPVENTIGIVQAIRETGSVREMLKNYVAQDDAIEVELPDYEHLEKPLVEVFTLDSATCAACTYMMGAANEAKKIFGEAIDMVEYKYTKKENIARCKKMGVPNLPSMYINGELKFRSLVPSKEELEEALRSVM